MNKNIKFLIIAVILIFLLAVAVIIIKKANIVKETATKSQTNGTTVVPTMRDTITVDSSWCETF